VQSYNDSFALSPTHELYKSAAKVLAALELEADSSSESDHIGTRLTSYLLPTSVASSRQHLCKVSASTGVVNKVRIVEDSGSKSVPVL
jgi:hypothetical protein